MQTDRCSLFCSRSLSDWFRVRAQGPSGRTWDEVASFSSGDYSSFGYWQRPRPWERTGRVGVISLLDWNQNFSTSTGCFCDSDMFIFIYGYRHTSNPFTLTHIPDHVEFFSLAEQGFNIYFCHMSFQLYICFKAYETVLKTSLPLRPENFSPIVLMP